MYRFLMVDDEDIIRTGFQARIDWAELGFEFLPPCTDGREAVERIGEHKPHVVMTDICMPFLDGIELSAWIAAHHPETLVVVLSGYDDFEYARASIRNKVHDYVLKPITARDLKELLGRLRERLDEHYGRGERLREEQARSHDMLRDDFLRRLLRGEACGGETDQRFLSGIFGEDAANRHYRVIRLDVGNPPIAGADGRGRDQELARLLGLVNGVLSPLGTGGTHNCVFLAERFAGMPPCSVVTVIFHDKAAGRVAKLADYLAGQLREALERSGFRAGVGIGSVREGPEGIAESCREASLVTGYRIIRGWGIFHYQAARETVAQAALDAGQWTDHFRVAIRTGDGDRIATLVGQVRDCLENCTAGARRVRQDVQALFSAVADELARNIDSEEPADRQAMEYYYHITDQLMGLDALESSLRELCALAMESVRRRGAGNAEKKVREFKDFISRHFADRDLSITRVAGEINVSPSYLSKIVKRQLDRSFVEYLTEYRLERAKELLVGSDHMTYQIADSTGYPDARYFSSIFKKMTGTTPSEYRGSRRVRP